MDSLTQIALGSAVCVAVMGRRTAVWKAALWGAVGGTLPDLDALVDHGDAISNMVLHRAESHSLFILSLLAPLLAWVAARGSHYKRWWMALWLVLMTHPLLDTMTVYGTQLLQPFTDYPFGVGSVFIIDPLYTLPLLVGVWAALRFKDPATGQRWNWGGVAISTVYLVWSVFAQSHVVHVARQALKDQGLAAQRVLVTPAPLQTLLWRVVALPDDPSDAKFYEAYISVLDGAHPVRWSPYDRGGSLLQQHADSGPVARMTAFTHGFLKAGLTPDGQLRITDLRMGQEPHYVFNFDVGSPQNIGQAPATQVSDRPPVGAFLRWVGRRMWGQGATW
jgi:inner membrane protein